MTTNTQSRTAMLNDIDVGRYLRDNPQFFARNPDVLKTLQNPGARAHTDGVVDLQAVMVERLRNEIQNLAACTQDVIETSRNNMTSLTRTHAAVLAVLSAHDGAHMARIISDDLPLLLDVDRVVFGFEQDIKAEAALRLPGARMFPHGFIDDQVGEGGDVLLQRDLLDGDLIFGEHATAVRSAGLARLRPGAHMAMGLLALGANTTGAFHPGQASDLLNFLARVVEKTFQKWLSPSA